MAKFSLNEGRRLNVGERTRLAAEERQRDQVISEREHGRPKAQVYESEPVLPSARKIAGLALV